MASLIAKKKGNQLYYYVVESARVEGQPRIVHQAYLGTADKVAALVKDRTSPVPLSASARDFGLPGALWLAAEQTGLFGLLETLWPAPRSGPSPARYLLLAAIHRICQPGPKTEVADWYRRTILHSVWGIPPERFTSQAFWDAFEKILPEHLDPLATGAGRERIQVLGQNLFKSIPEGLRGEAFRRNSPDRMQNGSAVPISHLGFGTRLTDAVDGCQQQIASRRRAGSRCGPERL